MKALQDLAGSLALPGLAGPEPKDVDHFCGHRVRGSLRPGFYVLTALFLLQRDEAGEFAQPYYQPLIPRCERRLTQEIALFIARALNAEAVLEGDIEPLPGIPAAGNANHASANFRFLIKKTRSDDANRFLELHRLPSDEHAHFLVYRARRSNPDHLIKSFLAIRPFTSTEGDAGNRRQTTLHVYQAPKDVGRTRRASPGQVVPLDSGFFIVAGQREEAMRDAAEAPQNSIEPFRAVEVLFFPWQAIQNSHLFGGVALTVNNDGMPILSRICARPTLIDFSTKIELGRLSIDELAETLAEDRRREQAVAQGNGSPARTKHFFEVYEEFGSLGDLAARIIDKCSNRPTRWTVAPGFKDPEGDGVNDLSVRFAIDEAFKEFARDENGPKFSFWRDLRFAPLASDDVKD